MSAPADDVRREIQDTPPLPELRMYRILTLGTKAILDAVA